MTIAIVILVLCLVLGAGYALVVKRSRTNSALTSQFRKRGMLAPDEASLQSKSSLGMMKGGSSVGKRGCKLCGGTGAVVCTAGECRRGIDKKNGSILERWTCRVCKGFSLVPCSCTGSKGLTPEQTGER